MAWYSEAGGDMNSSKVWQRHYAGIEDNGRGIIRESRIKAKALFGNQGLRHRHYSGIKDNGRDIIRESRIKAEALVRNQE